MQKRKQDVKPDASVYNRNYKLLLELRKKMREGYLTRQEVHTLRCQALNGDADGAWKGFGKIMAERHVP